MRRRASRHINVLVLMAVGASGCGNSSDGRQMITGTVILKGMPLEEGLIEFIPKSDAAAKEALTRSGAVIKDGTYVIPRDKGLLPGTYKVVISAAERTAGEPIPGEPPGPMKKGRAQDRIPADYNRTTKQVAEVTKEGPNRFDYTIP